MAAVLASHGCYRPIVEMSVQGSQTDDLSFSASITNMKFEKMDVLMNDFSRMKRLSRFRAEGRQTESARLRTNDWDSKMLSKKELTRSKDSSVKNGAPVNGSKVVVNGVSLVKKQSNTSALAKRQSNDHHKELSFVEELKVLPSDEGFSWSKDNYNAWQRSVDIWLFVISLRLRILFDNAKWAYIDGFTEEKQKARRRRTASWLREQVLQLGPTFIKLGQLSSTRSDLFPREFVDELAKLQDRVPAFSLDKAKAFIQKQLGASVKVLFKEFEDQPMAAASLGQVHRAVLHNGEKVVIKVQRPGLRKLFDIDLRNLKLVAEYFQRSETFGGPTRDWIGICDECSKILYEEIDYINEGRNADRFRRDFRNIKWVRVPLVLWDYTSTEVLTLEYVPGIKVNNLDMIDARGYNRSLIASRAIESYLIQILKTGFFHADPHPGNLAIDVDGSLIYYDFGMMGDIKSFTRERLLELFFAVYEKDARKVMQSLIDLGALEPTGDMFSVRRSVQFFLDNLLSQTPDQQQTLAAIGEDLFAIATDQPFRFPSTFTFVLRAFSTLEGIGYILDPDFSFVKVAAPYAQELLDLRQKQHTGPELVQELRRQANDARNSTISMPYRIQKIEEFVKQLEAGDLKLRVRVLESERAARKTSILQMATIYTVLGGTLMNVGITLGSQGNQVIANGSFLGAGNSIHHMSFYVEYSTLRAIIEDEMYTSKVHEKGIPGTPLANSLACLPEEPSSMKDWSRMEHKRSIENRIKKRVKGQYCKGKFYDLMDKVISDENTLQDAYDILRLDSNVDLSSERDGLCFVSLANELADGSLDVKANTFMILGRNGSEEYLVLPNLKLKVIQEAIRVALEVVYRPHFSKISHGCRSGRGRRSALRYISHDIGSPDWWFTLHMNKEADVHIICKLITLMEEKIQDVRLFLFIHSMLEAKVLNLKFGGFPKGQGLPQEGVLSPILMNIYLDAFDRELLRIFLRYECLGEETYTPIDGKCSKLRNWFRRQMKGHNDDQEEDLDLRMHACRFMDEIFIAVKGSKDIACSLKDEVQRYLMDSLYIELDDQVDILAVDSSALRLQFLGMVIHVRSTESERVRAVHKLKDKVQSFASQKQNIWDALTVRIGKKWLAHGLKRLKESEIRQLGLSTPILDQISHFRKEGMKTDHWFKSLIKIWLQDVNAKVEANEDIVLSKYIAEPALPRDLRESFYNFQKQVEEYVSLETDSLFKLLSDSSINTKCRSTNSKAIKIEAPTSFIIKCLRRYGVINVEGYPRCISDLLLQDDILIINWFSGLVCRWLKWYSDFDNFQDIKVMVAEYVRRSCIRTLATKHRMLESDIERKFESELGGIPLTEEVESTIASMASNPHFADDDQALTYGISYSGLCVLSLARVKVPSRPLCCSVMGCLADSPSIYTLHVKETQKFPGWNTGFPSAIYLGLKGRRIALCKQHMRDLYLGLVSLQSIDFGALSR